MNSIHDLGGMHGMGAIPFEENEPVFHEDWERKTFAVNMMLIMSGVYNADESRHAMEKIPALHWLASPYYEHWLDGFQRILVEKGLLTTEEIAGGKPLSALPKEALALTKVAPELIHSIATTNHPVTGQATGKPLFKAGDRVRARNVNPKTHTRLPRYIRGRVGTVANCPDAFVFADSRAHGKGDNPQHVYSVRFEGAELWGPDAGPKDAVYIDLYESYVERA